MKQSGAQRRRIHYGLAIVLIIAAGLATRRFPSLFPAGLEQYPGDALWAMMVFAGYCLLLPGVRTWQLAALALCTAFAVEFGQLYRAEWITALRATTLGHLVLGSTFHAWDLLAYTLGVATGAVLDALWLGARHARALASSARV